MIGDFGVPIAILIMVLVDYSIEDTYTQVRWSTLSSEEVLPGAGLSGCCSPPQPELPLNWADTPFAQHTPVPTLPVQLTNLQPRPLPCRS